MCTGTSRRWRPCWPMRRGSGPTGTCAWGTWWDTGPTPTSASHGSGRWGRRLSRGTTIEWTIQALGAEARKYLAALPLRLETALFLAVHGSPRDPVEEYILDLPTALAVFTESYFLLCLVGHSHIPGLFVMDRRGRIGMRALPAGESVPLDPAARYIVNVGSVGQPRDGDPRAAYLVLDTGGPTVTLRRLRYPVEVTQRKITSAGLPILLARRLAAGL